MLKIKLIKKPKKISLILGVLTIAFFIVLAKHKAKEDCIQIRDMYVNVEYKGLIKMKFEDFENHAIPTLTIINEDKQNKIFGSFRETSGLYNYSQVGDSIIKEKGSLKVKIIRADKDTIFNLDFNCP
jgi:hypothetical protein